MVTMLMDRERVSYPMATAVYAAHDGTQLVLRIEDYEALGEPSQIRVEVEADEPTA